LDAVTPGAALGTLYSSGGRTNKTKQHTRVFWSGLQGRGRPGVASDGSKGGNSLDAVTPGLTLGTLYSSGVGTNKTKQHPTVRQALVAPCPSGSRPGLSRNGASQTLLRSKNRCRLHKTKKHSVPVLLPAFLPSFRTAPKRAPGPVWQDGVAIATKDLGLKGVSSPRISNLNRSVTLRTSEFID